jgi:hypothetical protein
LTIPAGTILDSFGWLQSRYGLNTFMEGTTSRRRFPAIAVPCPDAGCDALTPKELLQVVLTHRSAALPEPDRSYRMHWLSCSQASLCLNKDDGNWVSIMPERYCTPWKGAKAELPPCLQRPDPKGREDPSPP